MSGRNDVALADALEILIDAARAAGANACDALGVERESIDVRVRLGETENVTVARKRRVGMRCLVGGATAVASTSDLQRSALSAFAVELAAMARVLPRDEHAGLPDPIAMARGPWPDLAIADEGQPLPDPAEATTLARRAEAAARSSDPRIVNSEGAELGAARGRIVFASTAAGFRGSYESTRFGLHAAPVAEEHGRMQRGAWGHSARRLGDLESPEAIGAEAARRALRQLGARRIPTARLPVVFEAPVAASLLGHLASAASGGSLYRGMSFLCSARGARILPTFVDVVDDGRRPSGLASRPFDGEGVATRRTTVVAGGVLSSFMLDSYAARRLALASTGNASRGVGGAPASGPTNLMLLPGPLSLARIISGIPRGLLVTGLSGMGVNLTTGDYSRGATGLWIENGEIAYAVDEITVAGNLRDMFLGIEAVADDPRPDATISCPSLHIAEMTVAGS